MSDTVVIIPTYNEAETIIPLLQRILALPAPVQVLVVDDDSPDGTAARVTAFARTNPAIHLLLRTSERGRGRAGVAGFRRALELGAERVIEMDGDGSHDPCYIPQLLQMLESYDMVIGSRGIAGGTDSERSLVRRLLTRAAAAYVRLLLGVPLRDVTSGYRGFRRDVLTRIPWSQIVSSGPAIVQEVLLYAWHDGARITEIPIAFVERHAGKSKLNGWLLLKSLLTVLRLRWRLRTRAYR